MRRNFTFTKKKYLRIAASILLVLSTGCNPKTDDTSAIRFCADTAENSHLKRISFSRNRDSVCKCAEADYLKKKYYVFWTGMPGEVRFANYLAAYAKKRYNIITIDCGCRNRLGIYYYNNQMAAFFVKAKKKSMVAVYLEAQDQYNKALNVDVNGVI